jgi:hypothetical protein
MSKAEEYQRIWHAYDSEHGGIPAVPREVVEWAVGRGLLTPPTVDPRALLADELAKAMREEYGTDPETGRRYRVNHAVRMTANGLQFALWADMRTAPREHMMRAFAQRRKQIVADCFQLKTDVDVYNGLRLSEVPIQMVLDFTDDVGELQTLETGMLKQRCNYVRPSRGLGEGDGAVANPE